MILASSRLITLVLTLSRPWNSILALFGAGFEAGFSDFEGSVTVLFDDVLSINDLTGDGGHPHRRRRVWHPNRVMCIESMNKSEWYGFFRHPGMTRELSHELSASD